MHTSEKGRQVRSSVSNLGEFVGAVPPCQCPKIFNRNFHHNCLYGGALEKPGKGTEFQVWVVARRRRKNAAGEKMVQNLRIL